MSNLASSKEKYINLLIFHRMGCSLEQLAQFCQRCKITYLAVFGSILRDNLKPESNMYFLVQFAPDIKFGLFETMSKNS